MQAGQYQLDARHLLLRMDVYGHAAPVVGDLERAVRMHGHLDEPAVPGQGLVHAVVHDFVGEMIRPRGVGVHARPAADGLQTAQHLDVGSAVSLAHAVSDA